MLFHVDQSQQACCKYMVQANVLHKKTLALPGSWSPHKDPQGRIHQMFRQVASVTSDATETTAHDTAQVVADGGMGVDRGPDRKRSICQAISSSFRLRRWVWSLLR